MHIILIALLASYWAWICVLLLLSTFVGPGSFGCCSLHCNSFRASLNSKTNGCAALIYLYGSSGPCKSRIDRHCSLIDLFSREHFPWGFSDIMVVVKIPWSVFEISRLIISGALQAKASPICLQPPLSPRRLGGRSYHKSTRCHRSNTIV